MRSLPLVGLTALALSLGACGGTQNRGLESVHQPVVSHTNYVYDVSALSSAGLSDADQAKLADWLTTLKVGYGDHIAIDDPAADSSTRAAIASVVGRYGILLDPAAPVTSGEIAPGMVRVVVSRSHAEVPGCPDWSRTAQPEFGANTMSNYGCATNATLAAMVANPDDLVRGHNDAPSADNETGSKAIKSYRTAAPTGAAGLKIESSKGGN